jgi:uncharacterized protein (TIGR03437 family)
MRAVQISRSLIGLTFMAGLGQTAAINQFIPFTYTNNVQTGLISTFPTGTYTATDGTQFSIPASGNNFYDNGSAKFTANAQLTISVSLPNATDVYTLMNAYYGGLPTTVATIQFVGTGGASMTCSLVSGAIIRDFSNSGPFDNSLNNGAVSGVNAANTFKCGDGSAYSDAPNGACLGSGGTGIVSTGSQGYYVVDEQHFSLGSTFLGQTLTQIILTNSTSIAQVILLGMTATYTPNPVPASTGVVTTSSNEPTIAANTWIEIHGTNLAQETTTWSSLPSTAFATTLPTSLGGVSATVNNKPAAIYYISPTQVNVLAPIDTAVGPVQVQLSTQFGSTTPMAINEQTYSLAFLIIDLPQSHVAAVHNSSSLNGTVIAPPGEFPGITTLPAQPGENVSIFATGFGEPATPITNQLTGAGALPNNPTITIGGLPATVTFAGLVAPGEYQFNVVIPSNAPNGDLPLIATYQGNTTQAQGTVITVHN